MTNINDKISRLKNKSRTLELEIQKSTIGYIVAGLGFVAGLAWNEAIKAGLEYLFPLAKDSLWAKFLYAIIITLVIVIVGTYLARINRQADKRG